MRLQFGCIGIIGVLASVSGDESSAVKDSVSPPPPAATAELVRAMMRTRLRDAREQAVCVAQAPPSPRPERSIAEILPQPTALGDLPAESIAELVATERGVVTWSQCEFVTLTGPRPKRGFNVRSTGKAATLVWLRDQRLVSDTAARGRVGYWGLGTGEYLCDARLRRGKWGSGHCVLEWQE